jgi:hypothetical protein
MAIILVNTDDHAVAPDEIMKRINMLNGIEDTEYQEETKAHTPLLIELGVALMNLENHKDLNCPLRQLRYKIERVLDKNLLAQFPQSSPEHDRQGLLLQIDTGGDINAIRDVLKNIRGVSEVHG